MRIEKKQKLKQLRRWRIRKKVVGTSVRPRMAVCFTNENIHVQFIDDDAGVTLAAASTVSKTAPKDAAANVAGAKTLGALAARRRNQLAYRRQCIEILDDHARVKNGIAALHDQAGHLAQRVGGADTRIFGPDIFQ